MMNAPQDRRRAVAELDATIDRAERTRAQRLSDLEGVGAATGRGAARARAMLRLAEEQLGRLRRSRQVLLGGDGESAA